MLPSVVCCGVQNFQRCTLKCTLHDAGAFCLLAHTRIAVVCWLMDIERTPTQWERDNPWEAVVAAQIGQAIAVARDRLGISQGELASVLGVSRNSIANYEIGRGIPRLGLLIRLAAALNTSPVSLMYPNPSDELSNLVEVLPGVTSTGFQAAQWFSGFRPSPSTAASGGEEAKRRADWEKGTESLRKWRQLADIESSRAKILVSGQAELYASQVAMYDAMILNLRSELGVADDA